MHLVFCEESGYVHRETVVCTSHLQYFNMKIVPIIVKQISVLVYDFEFFDFRILSNFNAVHFNLIWFVKIYPFVSLLLRYKMFGDSIKKLISLIGIWHCDWHWKIPTTYAVSMEDTHTGTIRRFVFHSGYFHNVIIKND